MIRRCLKCDTEFESDPTVPDDKVTCPLCISPQEVVHDLPSSRRKAAGWFVVGAIFLALCLLVLISTMLLRGGILPRFW